jgi:hypothetical protein
VFSHKIFVVEKSTTSHFTQQLACVDWRLRVGLGITKSSYKFIKKKKKREESVNLFIYLI